MMELIEWFWGSALVTIYSSSINILAYSSPSAPHIYPHPHHPTLRLPTLVRLSQTSLSTDSVDAIRPNHRGVLVMHGPGV